jgi:hypothetical protein
MHTKTHLNNTYVHKAQLLGRKCPVLVALSTYIWVILFADFCRREFESRRVLWLARGMANTQHCDRCIFLKGRTWERTRDLLFFERSNLGTNPGSFVFWKVEPGNEPGIFCFLKGWTWERTRDLLFFSVYLSTTHWATATQHMPLWRSQLTFNSNTDSANRFNVMPEIYTPFRKTRSQSYDFWIYNCICTTPAL